MKWIIFWSSYVITLCIINHFVPVTTLQVCAYTVLGFVAGEIHQMICQLEER